MEEPPPPYRPSSGRMDVYRVPEDVPVLNYVIHPVRSPKVHKDTGSSCGERCGTCAGVVTGLLIVLVLVTGGTVAALYFTGILTYLHLHLLLTEKSIVAVQYSQINNNKPKSVCILHIFRSHRVCREE